MASQPRPDVASIVHISRYVLAVALSFPALGSNAGTADSATYRPYRLLHEIKIDGDGFWDYLSVDAAARRLYVTHGGRAEVIDIDSNLRVGAITDTPGIHGVAIAADLKRGFTSNGREAKSSIVDLTTLTTVAKVDTGEGPDAIVFEPAQKEVYTFNGHAQSATVFEAQSGKILATIKLPGDPEFAVVDATAGRVYGNIADQSAVIVIDTHTHTIANTWRASPCESASGMAIDVEHHRLFLGCGNQRMGMMDSTNGALVASVPIGAGVDGVAFDPAAQLAFSSSADGTVTIAREESPDKLKVVQTLKTAAGARTMTLDPVTHRIYLSVAEQQSGSSRSENDRPTIVPNTFKVLVYGPE